MSRTKVDARRTSSGRPSGDRFGTIFLILATCAGCVGGDGEGTAGDGAIDSEGSLAEPPAEWRETRIERVVGGVPEAAGGGPIVAFAVGPQGEIVVSGRAGALVRYPPADEADTATVLRAPRAPGADTAPEPGASYETLGLAVDQRGRIWERATDSVRVFSPDGAPEAAYPAPGGRPVSGSRALRVTADGAVWVGVSPDFPSDDRPISFPRPAFARLDDRGRLVDTLFVPERFAEACPVLSEAHFQSGRFEDLRARYVPKVLWALAPDATLAAGCPAHPTLELGVARADGGGSPRSVRLRARPRARVSSEERRGFVNLWTVRMNHSSEDSTNASGTGTAGAAPPQRWRWRGDALPEVKPVYQDLLVGDLGRIWVWRPVPSVPRRTPPDWPVAGLPAEIHIEVPSPVFDVFEPDGAPTGLVTLPPGIAYSPFARTPPPVFRGERVWAVRQDPDGVSEVVIIALDPVRLR